MFYGYMTFKIYHGGIIYWSEGGSHLPPKDISEKGYGRLLKGLLTYILQ